MSHRKVKMLGWVSVITTLRYLIVNYTVDYYMFVSSRFVIMASMRIRLKERVSFVSYYDTNILHCFLRKYINN